MPLLKLPFFSPLFFASSGISLAIVALESNIGVLELRPKVALDPREGNRLRPIRSRDLGAYSLIALINGSGKRID